jgi:group I intron endonuclease
METNEERKWCVYMHTNKINGKKYIGQTCQNPPEKRWGKDGCNYDTTPHFFSSIKKYGWDNFEHEIIKSNLTQQEALNIEAELIVLFDTTNQNKGYNFVPFGVGTSGYKHTDEAKEKMSKAKQGKKPWNYGISPTEDTLKKLSESHMGYKPSEEQRRKIGEASKLWWSNPKNRESKSGINNSRYGVQLSEETKMKISQSQKGKIIPLETIVKASNARVGLTQSEETKQKIQKNNQNKRAVLQFSLDGKFIAEYLSTREAEKNTGVKYQYIIACCKHQKQEAGGFLWEYKEKRKDDYVVKHGHRKNIAVIQLSIDEELISEYKSAAEAGKDNNMDRSTIVRCCKGRQKTAGGYKWMYAEDYYKTIQND